MQYSGTRRVDCAFYRVTRTEARMGQQHKSQDNMKDERTKKAQQDSDRTQKRGSPGTFKNDPDKPGEKAKSPPKSTRH